jgi:anti-sigma factor RsiW
MNCENCQELIHDLLDGTISRTDELTLNTHLSICMDCDSVRMDLTSIVSYCQTNRGEYEAPPNEQALWLRIRNVVEAESANKSLPQMATSRKSFFADLLDRTFQVSLPQLAASVVALVLLVSLATVVGIRRWGSTGNAVTTGTTAEAANYNEQVWQRQQVINYWNQRVELNKARWNPEMRETFDRNLRVIDQAVNDSLNELNRNPHDEVSEQMLNESLNDKLALLKEFSDL